MQLREQHIRNRNIVVDDIKFGQSNFSKVGALRVAAEITTALSPSTLTIQPSLLLY